MFSESASIILEQLKIVFASITKRRGGDLNAFSLSDYLHFLGVSLLFITVMPFLAFWTFNRLLTDINRHHFKNGITELKYLLTWQPKLA